MTIDEPIAEIVDHRNTALARQRALADLARMALLGMHQRPLLARAAEIVQAAVDAGSCGVYEFLPVGHDLLLRAAAFAPGRHRAPLVGGPVPATADLMVPIGTSPRFGFLAAGRDHGGFDQDDRHFAVQVAGILTAALERLRQEADQRRVALHDPLTGLPNRALILDHLKLALDRSPRRPANVAVLFVDLDHFKAVNDTMGHQAGDAVLMATGERLRAALRPPDTVGRLGGDEFVAVCEDIGGEAGALAVAARLAASLEAPVLVAGRNVRIRASIGVALSGSATTDPAALLTEADGAMFWAKRTGRGVALFDERMQVGTGDLARLEAVSSTSLDRPLVARLVRLLEDVELPDRLDPGDLPGS